MKSPDEPRRRKYRNQRVVRFNSINEYSEILSAGDLQRALDHELQRMSKANHPHSDGFEEKSHTSIDSHLKSLEVEIIEHTQDDGKYPVPCVKIVNALASSEEKSAAVKLEEMIVPVSDESAVSSIGMSSRRRLRGGRRVYDDEDDNAPPPLPCGRPDSIDSITAARSHRIETAPNSIELRYNSTSRENIPRDVYEALNGCSKILNERSVAPAVRSGGQCSDQRIRSKPMVVDPSDFEGSKKVTTSAESMQQGLKTNGKSKSRARQTRVQNQGNLSNDLSALMTSDPHTGGRTKFQGSALDRWLEQPPAEPVVSSLPKSKAGAQLKLTIDTAPSDTNFLLRKRSSVTNRSMSSINAGDYAEVFNVHRMHQSLRDATGKSCLTERTRDIFFTFVYLLW